MHLLPVAKFVFVLLGSCLLLLGSACSSGPAPKLYLLEPVFEASTQLESSDIKAIGLSTVVLPGYASDDRLASRVGGSQVVHDDHVKWADSPDEAVTRVLANRLRYYLGAQVVVEPFPRGYEAQVRVEVVFEKLIREPSGGTEMSGQIRISSGDGKQLNALKSFQIVRYGKSQLPDAFFEATSLGLNDISLIVASHFESLAKQN